VVRSSFPPLLELRSGEGRAFGLAFAVLGLLIGAHTLVETARDTLFLSRLPPQRLAFVYVAVAVGTLILAPFSRRLVEWVGARNALVLTLLSSAFGIAWFRLQAHDTLGVFGLYVFGGLAITMLVAEFWILASGLFTAAQGRRLFGPLAAGGVLGAVAGAALSTALLMRDGVDALLVAASFAFVLAALVATFFEIEEEGVAFAALAPPLLPNALSDARREPLTQKIALMVALSTALSVVVDYVFKARAVTSYPSAELGSFFAHYYLVLNAVTLVLQVFLAGPLVARLGVLGVSLFSPTLLVLGALAATLTGVPLLTAVTLRGLDGGLRNSVQRVALELLWAPIERHQKAGAKALVDGVVSRGAQAAAAVGLGLLTSSGKAGLPTLTFSAAVLAALWLAASMRVQKPYLELFRKALGRGDLEREGARELDLTAVQALLEALARPDADDVIAAMNLLAERGRSRLIPALILYHDDERVLRRALELFAESERRDWFALGERLLQHRSLEVRLAAVRALALADALPALERAAQHEDVEVRARAALHLAQRSGHGLRADPRVQQALSAVGETGVALRLALIEAMGAHPSLEATRLLLELGKDPALTGAVTAALATCGDPIAIDFLIERLGTRRDRALAQKALVHIGAPAQAALEERLGDVAQPHRVRLHLPLTLARFENIEAVRVLLEVLRSEQHSGFIRYKALRGLSDIARRTQLPIEPTPIHAEIVRNALEYLRLLGMALPLRQEPAAHERTSLSLVLGLVEDKLGQALERLERLVQITQRTDDVPGVFHALRSADRHERSRAAEYLDALARGWDRRREGRLAQLLGMVFGEASDQERVQASAASVGAAPATTAQAIEGLLDLGDPLLAAFAQHARQSLPQARPDQQPEPRPMLASGVFEPGTT
jgi:AAA family ATP:ADP antiporter